MVCYFMSRVIGKPFKSGGFNLAYAAEIHHSIILQHIVAQQRNAEKFLGELGESKYDSVLAW